MDNAQQPNPVANPATGGSGGPASGGGARGSGVGVSTGNFNNHTEWHWGNGEVTIVCYASRLCHLNMPTDDEYRAYPADRGTGGATNPPPDAPVRDDYHAQIKTPWSLVDANAWGIWLKPSDFQQLITICEECELVELEQGISNLVIKTKTELSTTNPPTPVYNNDLTATLQVAEDTNNTLPYTPAAMRCETLNFIPWRPTPLPLYRYYIPWNRFVQPPELGVTAVHNQVFYQYGQFFPIETTMEIDMLRTGDAWESGTYKFNCNKMNLFHHWQATRMLGMPPNTTSPENTNSEGTNETPQAERYGWHYGQYGNYEATVVRPFTSGYKHPEWFWGAGWGGPELHPAPPAAHAEGLAADEANNGEQTVTYDILHGGDANVTTANVAGRDRWSVENWDKSTLQGQTAGSFNPEYTFGNNFATTNGNTETDVANYVTEDAVARFTNSYSPYAAIDLHSALYPQGMIWDKQPDTDHKPSGHTNAPFICKDTPPGQILVKLSPNLTDQFSATSPSRIITFAHFYWNGKLTIKAKLRAPSQFNPYKFPTWSNDKHQGFFPDRLGQFALPHMTSRYLPKVMY